MYSKITCGESKMKKICYIDVAIDGWGEVNNLQQKIDRYQS